MKTVIVEVRGGVVQDVTCVPGVSVEVFDYDEIDEDDGLPHLCRYLGEPDDALDKLLEAVECTARDLEGYAAGQWDGPTGFLAIAEALRMAAAKVKGAAK